ncbi:hypothetical protein OIO90_000758 [Microbotryomycetes sp. JL221]|nr:hypothetical protein OIO90_000758 [Microbotryomycetes sp. JL221]
MAVALPPPLPRRVTYVLPPPSVPPPVLSLTPASEPRVVGRTAPSFIVKQGVLPQWHLDRFTREQDTAHPRHRLNVQALALDLSTALQHTEPSSSTTEDTDGYDGSADNDTPGGLLYTAGRDGLLCSWELNLPTKRRRRRYGSSAELDNPIDQDDFVANGALSEDSDDNDGIPHALNELNLDGLPREPRKSFGVETSSGSGGGILRSSRRSSESKRNRAVSEDALCDPDIPLEERWQVDQDKLDTVKPKSKFRQCIQSHTDWINDIVLCNYNRTLVSASSDSLVLAWNPHSSNHEDQMMPQQIGRHGDYVRCLAAARDAHWVASGGFDRKIRLWDVGEGRSSSVLDLTSSPASIYSLCATPSGSLIAAGTPERVVRVWDPRSRRQVARLGGHTDNVRDVLLSEEGKWLLTASSDSTVKLWSLSAQKCLYTFQHHTSSVWSLFSQHPNLEIFYSGDRAGNICKVDLEGTGDPREGECIVLARDGPEDSIDSASGTDGITQLVAQDDSYVWAAGNSSSVKRWRDVAPRTRRAGAVVTRREDFSRDTASETLDLTELEISELPSPRHHRTDDKDTTSITASRGPTVSFMEGLTSDLTRTTSSPTPTSVFAASVQSSNAPRPSSLRSRPPAQSNASQTSRPLFIHSSSSNVSTSLFDIPYDSLVPLTLPEDNYFSPAFTNRARDPDAATIYSSMSVGSLTQTGMTQRMSLSTSPPTKRPVSIADAQDQATQIARRQFEERQDCSEATPFRTSPDDIIVGRHGLIRCEILNDRRHVLTIDTEGEVALWDIVTGRCIGVFAPEELTPMSRRPSEANSTISATGSFSSDSVHGLDVLEFVKEKIEGEAAVATWCKCDTRVGSLSIHLEENRVFDGEVYADESGAGRHGQLPPDHRLCLGKWVLRNLFDSWVEAEMELRTGGGTPLASTGTNSSVRSTHPSFISLSDLNPGAPMSPSSLKSPGMTIALATPALKRAKLPDLPMPAPTSPRNGAWDLSPIPQSPGGTPRPFEAIASRTGAVGTGGATPEARTPVLGRGDDYFSLPTISGGTPQSPAPAQTPSLATSNTPGAESGSNVTSNAGGGGGGGRFMGRFKMLGKGSKRPTIDTDVPASSSPVIVTPVEPKDTRPLEEQQQHLILETIFSRPLTPATYLDAPPLHLPHDIAINISEEKDQGAAWQVTYRGLVGTGRADLSALEQKAPLWLMDFLLGNRVLTREPIKVSFLIHAWRGDKPQLHMQELPNTNARLTANRGLRLKKVTSYVADKLELTGNRRHSRTSSIGGVSDGGTSSSSSHSSSSTSAADMTNNNGGGFAEATFVPEQSIEILVGDHVLPLNMTLAAARSFYWKQGGDLMVHYRFKKAPVTTSS